MSNEKSDDELVEEARNVGGNVQPVVAMMRRLKDVISEQTTSLLASQQTTNDLTASIKKLTVWLVILTIAIGLMTLVQAVAAWKVLTR